MKRCNIILLSLFLLQNLAGQNATKSIKVVCFKPEETEIVNGLILCVSNRPCSTRQRFNGANLELLGDGWLTLFLFIDDAGYIRNKQQTINGLSVGLSLLNGKVNGLSFSPSVNTTFYFNGLKAGLINFNIHVSNGLELGLINFDGETNGIIAGAYNSAVTTRGLQIGLVNKTDELKGLQIGLININESRIMPFINWGTRQVNDQ